MRFFSTAGPIRPEMHYHVPPLARLGADNLLLLIRQWKYFVLHAPRQTGKTTALLALRDLLNEHEDSYRCVYANFEAAQASREDVECAMRSILGELATRARRTLGDATVEAIWPETLSRVGPNGVLRQVLGRWAEADPRPLVLLLDEIDSLVGDSLLSLLRQLRAGYDERPAGFPQSVVLCGVRDVRDYRIRSSSQGEIIPGGSAFNVKATSLRLGDFSRFEVASLIEQHTEATGQEFAADAQAALWEMTRGQPWLVNALAYRACFESETGRDRTRPIDVAAVHEAREALVQARETHLDQLTDKLREDRVRRVIEPVLGGAAITESIREDDLQYVRDLGLVSADGPVAIANPIYREVIPRALTYVTQETEILLNPAWYVAENGKLQFDKLMASFQEFFREHSEHWVDRFQYKEAGPQLLLQAFLQRVVNSGGRIEREYGLGRMRTDLLVVWPVAGAVAATQKVVVECKLLHKSLDATLRTGLEQTRAYMDRCAAAEGHLVIFDRTEGTAWRDKLFRREDAEGGQRVVVWGM